MELRTIATSIPRPGAAVTWGIRERGGAGRKKRWESGGSVL